MLLFCLLFIYLASIRRIIRLSSVGPLCLIFLCLFGPLPSSFAMLPNRTRNSSPTVASAPALVSGTLASASISPEFLVLVIQANQTPISATVQQWLSAAVGAPSISMQGHFCSRVVGVIFGQSHGTFERHWHTPTLVFFFGISAINCCWVPASEYCNHFHFSTSRFAVKRFARYVLIYCCSTFFICVFLC